MSESSGVAVGRSGQERSPLQPEVGPASVGSCAEFPEGKRLCRVIVRRPEKSYQTELKARNKVDDIRGFINKVRSEMVGRRGGWMAGYVVMN